MISKILGLWIALNIIAIITLVATCVDGGNCSFVNPKVIYKNVKVNWFGAWLLAVVCNVCFPVVAIPYWIYKLCTIGRQ